MKKLPLGQMIVALAAWAGMGAKWERRNAEIKLSNSTGHHWSKRHKPQRGINLGSGSPCYCRKAVQMSRAHNRRLGRDFYDRWQKYLAAK